MKLSYYEIIKLFIMAIFLFNCARGREDVIMVEKKNGNIVAVKQGYIDHGKFVLNGVSWSYRRIKFNESVTRLEYKDGIEGGSLQSVSRGAFDNPLSHVVKSIDKKEIGSEDFAKWYWNMLKGEQGGK